MGGRSTIENRVFCGVSGLGSFQDCSGRYMGLVWFGLVVVWVVVVFAGSLVCVNVNVYEIGYSYTPTFSQK